MQTIPDLNFPELRGKEKYRVCGAMTVFGTSWQWHAEHPKQ